MGHLLDLLRKAVHLPGFAHWTIVKVQGRLVLLLDDTSLRGALTHQPIWLLLVGR